MLREIIYKQGQLAKDAAEKLAAATEEQKNKALLAMAQELRVSQQEIIAANHLDLEEGEKVWQSTFRRLLITPDRLMIWQVVWKQLQLYPILSAKSHPCGQEQEVYRLVKSEFLRCRYNL